MAFDSATRIEEFLAFGAFGDVNPSITDSSAHPFPRPPGRRAPASTTRARLDQQVQRHREIGARLSKTERDRLWIRNPFVSRWHYTFPEMIRVQVVHVRHHARLIAEIS